MVQRRQKDYSKGKIYLIRNTVNDLLYVGSTCQTVAQRMSQHRSDAKTRPTHIGPIYQAMQALGVDKFYCEWHSDFPCERGEQLSRREGEVIRELGTLKNGYNENQAGRTKAEWYMDNAVSVKAQQGEYYKQNINAIKARHVEYTKNNVAAIKEKQAKWRKDNAASIKVKRAARYLKKKAEKAALTTNP